MTAKEVEKIIVKAGWYYERTKGSHNQFKHKDYGYVVTIPQHKGDLAIGTLKSILKAAHVENKK